MKKQFFAALFCIASTASLHAVSVEEELVTVAAAAIDDELYEAVKVIYPYLGAEQVAILAAWQGANRDPKELSGLPAAVALPAAPKDAQEFADRYVKTMNENALAIAQGFTDQNMPGASARRADMQDITQKVAATLQ